MILGNIKNAGRYNLISPFFEKAFNFLSSEDLKDLPDGRYDIWGDELYAIVTRMDGKLKEDAFLEFHNKYTDIHFLIEGSERQGWKNRADCIMMKSEYDAEKEAGFYSDIITNWAVLNPGEFTVFFPEDAHAPAVSDGKIHKVIIKVLAEG